MGDAYSGVLSIPCRTGFNSATAVTPWVTWRCEFGAEHRTRLQFGHGGDAVGDWEAFLRKAPEYVPLQFGHGGDAVGDSGTASPSDGVSFASIRPRR